VNNVTATVEIQQHLPHPVSNLEYLTDEFWHLYDYIWSMLSELTVWNLF